MEAAVKASSLLSLSSYMCSKLQFTLPVDMIRHINYTVLLRWEQWLQLYLSHITTQTFVERCTVFRVCVMHSVLEPASHCVVVFGRCGRWCLLL